MKKVEWIKSELLKYEFDYVKLELEGFLNRGSTQYHTHGAAHSFIKSHLPKELDVKWSGVWSDGGDTELSITFPTAQLELAPQILKTFNKLGKACGQKKINVNNAGMHITILMDSVYPSTHAERLGMDQLENFKRQVTKALPALWVLAAHGKRTRSADPRVPWVSINAGKHHAIYYRNNSFEYRLFDPCYHEPMRVIDNFNVIANTLKYLDPSTTYDSQRIDWSQFYSWQDVRGHFDRKNTKLVLKQLDDFRPKWVTSGQIAKRTGLDRRFLRRKA